MYIFFSKLNFCVIPNITIYKANELVLLYNEVTSTSTHKPYGFFEVTSPLYYYILVCL
jgi:hypothetical protein